MATRFTVDFSRGFDVMVGRDVIAHYADMESAKAHARAVKSAYVRYWGVKP